MGIFDKAKDVLGEHTDKVDGAVDKAGDLVDEKTGGKHVGQVDKGQDIAKDKLGNYLNADKQPPV